MGSGKLKEISILLPMNSHEGKKEGQIPSTSFILLILILQQAHNQQMAELQSHEKSLKDTFINSSSPLWQLFQQLIITNYLGGF